MRWWILRDVTYVDAGGERLLAEMRGDGAEFISSGVETKYLVERLK